MGTHRTALAGGGFCGNRSAAPERTFLWGLPHPLRFVSPASIIEKRPSATGLSPEVLCAPYLSMRVCFNSLIAFVFSSSADFILLFCMNIITQANMGNPQLEMNVVIMFTASSIFLLAPRSVLCGTVFRL